MAEGRSRAAWGHTSAVLAMLANCHRDPKKTRPYRAAQFNPHADGGVRRKGRGPVSVERLTREMLTAVGHKQNRS